jgi:hypothetical protein
LSWLDFCLIQSATKDISTILGPTVIIFNDYILQKWRTGHRSPKYRLQPSLPSSRAREVSDPSRNRQQLQIVIELLLSFHHVS